MDIDQKAEELIDNALLALKETALLRHSLPADSPIERLLRSAFLAHEISCPYWVTCKYMDANNYTLEQMEMIKESCFGIWTCLIFPQVRVGDYRVDFLAVACVDLGTGSPKRHYLAIECDGHEFHEKTKEQAARDKARDRYLTSRHVPVMRFTGSEIWRDPSGCALEALYYFEEHFTPKQRVA